MELTLIILNSLFILLSILPFVPNAHWVFRVPDFLKMQLLPLQITVFVLGIVYNNGNLTLIALLIAQLALIIYHAYILLHFTPMWKKNNYKISDKASKPVKVISCNIYQFNTEYKRFTDLIQREQPDIFLTMESNSDWEQNMRVLEKDYPNFEKVTLENTYGMHFYTRLKVNKVQTHYFVADDLPSIEAELETEDGHRFIFFGVHPPPPSPTEEQTSKERDGDLLSVAKRVRDYKLPVVVTGDFNNVAWAKSSKLFKKTSRLIDGRIGRGIIVTFHAKYWFFRVPLDLLFHSPTVFIDKLHAYPSVGSDHFPIGCTFRIDSKNDEQQEEIEDLEKGEMNEVNEMIKEGKEEESDNREEVVTED